MYLKKYIFLFLLTGFFYGHDAYGIDIRIGKSCSTIVAPSSANKTQCMTDNSSCITHTRQGNNIVLVVEHKVFAPYTYYLKLTLDNLKPEKDIPEMFVLRGEGTKRTFTLKPIKPNTAFSYNVNYKSNFGRYDAKHDANYVYRLPFEVGKSHELTQGYFGTFSHQDKHAVDFSMPEGTPVYLSLIHI